jgi:membrane-associated protein
LVAGSIAVAAVLGEQVGYLFGRKVGPSLFRRPDSRLFKMENIEKAHAFFEHHGPKAIVMACFVPIVRTFTPIVAGVSKMNYRTFATFNILGGTLWGAGVTLLGYWLGQISFVANNIEAMLVLVVLLSVVPIGIEYLRSRGKEKPGASGAAGTAATTGAADSDDLSPDAGTDPDLLTAAPRSGRHRANKR